MQTSKQGMVTPSLPCLSAQAYWTPDATFTSYLNYGAAISEVHLFQITILAVQITILVVFKKKLLY